MKIDICIVSSNDNSIYYTFYPYIKPIWEKILGIKCILIFVGNELPELLKPYSIDIIMYKPIENIDSAFIAQNIRLLYPSLLNCSNGIIIADIDIIPLNQDYFIKSIEHFSDNNFIYYTYENKCDDFKEYYMCYNVGLVKTWSDIFNIKNIDDIKYKLSDWYSKIEYNFDNKYRSKCKGFHNDQLMLYKYLNEWNNKNTNNLILLSTNIRRLDVYGNKIFKNKLKILEDFKNNNYDDFHIPKKFNKQLLLIFLK